MRILNKYLLSQTIKAYIFLLMVFVGLYFIIDLFSTLSDLLKSKPPVSVVFSYYLYMLPLILLRVGPFSLLLSTLYVVGELGKKQEIAAMRALGQSTWDIFMPLLVFSLIVSAASFYLQERVLMDSQKKVEEIKLKFIRTNNAQNNEQNFAFPEENRVIFARSFSAETGTMSDVTIFEEDKNGNIAKKTICDQADYTPNGWQGQKVTEYNLDAQDRIVGNPAPYPRKAIDLKGSPRELMAKKTVFAEFASLKALRKEIKRMKKSGETGSLLTSRVADYHQKMWAPFANFFLILAALPFGGRANKKRVELSAMGTGLIFWGLYYALGATVASFAKTGVLLPSMSGWLIPACFGTIGLTGFMSVR